MSDLAWDPKDGFSRDELDIIRLLTYICDRLAIWMLAVL